MAKEWGFENDADDEASGQNPSGKMPKANPIIGTIKKYTDKLGNMLEQSAGGDGAPVPLLPESARKADNPGTKKPSSLDPDPVSTPVIPVPYTPKEEDGQDRHLADRIRLPDGAEGPVGDRHERFTRPGNRTGDKGIIITPDPRFRDDNMIVTPKSLNGNGNNSANGFASDEGQLAGAGIGAESANLPDLSFLIKGIGSVSDKKDVSATHPNTVASNKNAVHTDHPVSWEAADPVHWLVKKESDNNIARTEKILNAYFTQTSDMAEGLAGARHARFDPGGLTWYSKEERELMHALIPAYIGVANSKFDPEMARKQAYPFLKRSYDAANASMGGDHFSGLQQGTFSFDTLNEQVKTHLYDGTRPDLRLSQTVANAMNSLDKTPYGTVTKNFMASVHRGMINLSENSINSALTIMSSAPPPEIAMFHYQQMYIAHGNDTAGMARELENMIGFKGQLQQEVSARADRTKGLYADMRSPDYNQLEWMTLDPSRAAWMRPDKLTGDFFEKLLPAILGLKGVSKAGEGLNLARKGEMFIKGAYVANTSYSNAYLATKRNIMTNPWQIERDPDYKRYRQESTVPEERGKEIYAEAKARQSGVQAALLSVVTFTGTTLFRQATDTGADHAVISLFKQLVGSQTSMMAKEAFEEAIGVDYKKYNDNENYDIKDKQAK